ncbi:MAG: ATP-binding cassette domain-containing protein [Rhodothermales bacterium]
MFTLEAASKTYGTTPALHATTLAFTPSTTSVLIGPSGCGKSTLLRLLIGLIQPTTGSVTFDGQALSYKNVTATRHRIGYVIQEGGLFPHLTAYANAALVPKHLGWSANQIQARIEVLAQQVRLPMDRLRQYPQQLSGGQRQRVGLIRALMLDPDALLLDEPLGALDPMIRADLQDELRALFAKLKKTAVLVTHDMAEAAFFGDTIHLMRAGQIVQSGTFDDLLERPTVPFVTEFIQAQRRWAT